MEALGLILIAGALFCYSWYILGLYPDGRTVGVFIGALGLAALIFATTLDPMLLIGGSSEALLDAGGNASHRAYSMASGLAETTMMKSLIVVWAVYAIGVGTQAIWDYDERAIGFYGAVAAIVSVTALFFFAGNLGRPYGDSVVISLSTVSLLLTVVAGMLFFYLAVPFSGLRPVAGWFTLVGSVAVMAVGVAIGSTAVVSSLL